MSVYKLADAKGAILVLCYLGSNGSSTTAYRLIRSVKLGRHAVEHSVQVLADLGLVEDAVSDAFPFARTIRLTRRGRALLESRVRDLPGFFWEERLRAGPCAPGTPRARSRVEEGLRHT